jgi:hypothetical protein
VVRRGDALLAAITERGTVKALAARDVPEAGRSTQGKDILALARGDQVRALLTLMGAAEEEPPAPRAAAPAKAEAAPEATARRRASAKQEPAAETTPRRARRAPEAQAGDSGAETGEAQPATRRKAVPVSSVPQRRAKREK